VNCAAGLSPFLMTRAAAGGEQAKTRQFCAGPEESEYRRTNRSAHRIATFNAGGNLREVLRKGSGLKRLYSRNSRALLCRSQERSTQ
jgi:hypothetical protein